jgi:NodT family efflux transporter outer membrane factor (OMF) lipoprotein
MKARWVGTYGCILATLFGCEVGPDYHPPKVTVSAAYHESAATRPSEGPSRLSASPAVIGQWWTSFNDAELNSLIDRAMRNNLDLRLAESRLRQARAQRGMAVAALFPDVNADGGYQHARGSKNVAIPLKAFGFGGGGGAPGDPPPPSPAIFNPTPGGPQSPLGNGGFPGVETDLYQAGFDASWEIDVFGGVRRSIEAADADTAAALENQRDVLVSLAAEVAENYVQLRANQRQAQIDRQNLQDQEDTLKLTQSRYHAGFATELDVAREAAQVASTAATLPALETSVRQSIHQLGVLLGQHPDALSDELSAAAPIPPVPPQVPVGVPADLLLRRPDIRRAERQLAAATARIGVAESDLFPKLSITGSMGLDSSRIKSLLDWQSRYFVISPGVSWPIFDAGLINSNIKVQKELAQQAQTSYESAVLNALREVEDALSAYRTEQVRRKALADAVDASATAVDLARQQYQKGVIDFLQVLDAERSLLEAQDVLTQSDSAISTDLIALYKSLGGGWEGS